MPTKGKKNKLDRWVAKRFSKVKATAMTAAALAEVASRAMKVKVNANTMCRALLRANIRFKADALDPIPRHYSKVDLLKVRVDYLEKRLSKIEKAKKAAA